jgi:signal transduction histidine kinase/ligand-binding sensor domain-containing protein
MFRRNVFAASFVRTILAFGLLYGDGIFSAPVWAAPNYFIRTWQVENGLPQNSVTAVVQTRDGYLWLGTYSGLARFDGVRFTVFDGDNIPELRNSRVTSLFEAEDGTLWIGHENGEVTKYRDGRFQAVEYHAVWSGGKIGAIGTDEDGDLWLQNEEGVLARLKDGLVLTPQAGSAARLVDFTRSAGKTIWVLRDGRVSLLEHGQLQVLPVEETVTNILGICASRDGGLWVADDRRLRKWKDGQWITDLGEAPWGESVLHRMIEMKSGALVASTTEHGLYIVFPDNAGKSLNFSRASGFPSDWITSLQKDREGNLWVGTGGAGLVMMRQSLVETVGPPDLWQGRAVLSVNTDRNGALWVGTEGAGLYRFQYGTWTNFGSKEGIFNPYVWSIAEDAGGDLWVGTWNAGLFVRHGSRFDMAPGLGRVNASILAIFSEGPGRLLVGTGEGLLQYDAGENSWLRLTNGTAQQAVRAVIKDHDGTVWFGLSGGGLGCLKNGVLQQFRRSDGLAGDYIECLHLDDEGALWIGTFGGGLNRLKQGHFAVIGKNQGLPNNVICDIEDDGNGFFWMSSHGGLLRVGKKELDRCADGQIKEVACATYGLSEGLPTLECSEGRGCKTADGRLWFPTTKGLVNVDPRHITVNPLPPPVVIEKMLVDDRTVAEAGEGSAPLKISPGRHRIEFQYTGLSLIAPQKVRFKYRLNGFETEWADAGAKRMADYNYIPPGDYSFQVIAGNNDGVWNDIGASIAFKVLPYFWQTLWFRILASTLLVAASGGLVWFETRRRMWRKMNRLEQQRAIEHERARIAHDIHDDLGAHLTRITMLSESTREELDNPIQAAAGLNQIYDTARELTRAMDEIVWAVNPKHDTLDSLVSYLEQFAQNFLAMAGVRCRLDMPLELPEWRLTTEARHNLFLAFKEALNNVARHAQASEVHVCLSLKPETFELSVEDNGRGLEPGATKTKDRFASGNGLKNMVRRLETIGGRCDIRSQPGQGTKVLFVVPFKSQ